MDEEEKKENNELHIFISILEKKWTTSNKDLTEFYKGEKQQLDDLITISLNGNNSLLSIEDYGRRCSILGAFMEKKSKEIEEKKLEQNRREEKELQAKSIAEEREKESLYFSQIEDIFKNRDEKHKNGGYEER